MQLNPSAAKPRLEKLPALFAGWPAVLTVYLFGSQAAGEATPFSDVDLAVVYDGPVSWREEADLEVAVADALGVDEVDLLNLERLDALFRYRIIATGRLVYERDPVRAADFVEKALVDYWDCAAFYARSLGDYMVSLEHEYANRPRQSAAAARDH